MKAQTPADGIKIDADLGDSKFYTVSCSCGSPDDELEFYVEVDEDAINITVNTVCTQKTDFWTKKFNAPRHANDFVDACYTFANALWMRLRLTKEIWIRGYVEYKSYTIMNKQQALNYAETLKTAIAEVEKHGLEQRSRRDLVAEVKSLNEEIKRLKWAAQEHD